jgi:uncharacterized membrane protein YgdD (TMEM256/DUF423 family)
MHKQFFITACLLSALAVVLGAFGAHGLQKMADEKTISVYKTGVEYHLYHSFALLFTAFAAQYGKASFIKIAGYLFIGGIICFSGSLYAITYYKVHTQMSVAWLGPITPIGGLLFMAGWVCLAFAVAKNKAA